MCLYPHGRGRACRNNAPLPGNELITYAFVMLLLAMISHSTVSTLYIGIAKDILHFHFQFEVDFTFNDIEVKNA